ncbi:hypothetical protein AMS59_03125 [Lysinibacillus sp. FJAT-14745]|uniref:hypothetical protein n=1 Tax=Lysinibacillus sp. FJAT-14745 TaxID=1704289 RepID=UPI0006ABD340|nr:hypothetical protein [Lysinibacillus sp. FJAT-14745]KOP80397.1 hypothetical protein AMS59_03125 [Lysinibacillus sp. FJAT-14745]
MINSKDSVKVGHEKVNVARDNFIQIDNAINDVQTQTESVTAAIRTIHQDIEKLVKEINYISEVSMKSISNVQSVAASSTHLSKMAIDLQESIQAF